MLLSVMGGLARCCKAGWTDIRATQLPVREGGGHNEPFRVSGVWHRQALVLSSSPWNWLFDICCISKCSQTSRAGQSNGDVLVQHSSVSILYSSVL